MCLFFIYCVGQQLPEFPPKAEVGGGGNTLLLAPPTGQLQLGAADLERLVPRIQSGGRGRGRRGTDLSADKPRTSTMKGTVS